MVPPEFAELFGHPASARATAPGRVNLMGHYTDYNAGFVPPVAIRKDAGNRAGREPPRACLEDQFADQGIVG